MFPGRGRRQSAAECTKSSFWYNLPVHSFDLRVSVLVKRWQHCSVRWLLTLFLWVYLLLTRLPGTIDPGMLVLDWLCFCLSPRAALSRPQPARHETQSRQFIKIWWWVTAWSDLLELETIHQHWPGLSLRAEVAATFVTMNQVLSHVSQLCVSWHEKLFQNLWTQNNLVTFKWTHCRQIANWPLHVKYDAKRVSSLNGIYSSNTLK